MPACNGRTQASVRVMSASCGSMQVEVEAQPVQPGPSDRRGDDVVGKGQQRSPVSAYFHAIHRFWSAIDGLPSRTAAPGPRPRRPADTIRSCGARAERCQRRHRRADHQCSIERQRAGMAQSELDQPLVAVVAVSLPDSARRAAGGAAGSRWHPRQTAGKRAAETTAATIPAASLRCRIPRPGSPTVRARRRPGKYAPAASWPAETGASRPPAQAECRRTVASRPESSHRIGAESDDGHRAGKAIAAIHEVVQIGDPDDRDGHRRGNDQIGRRGSRAIARRWPLPTARTVAAARYAATVVEKRNDDDRGERKEPGLRTREPDNAGAPAEPDGQTRRRAGPCRRCSERAFGRSNGNRSGATEQDEAAIPDTTAADQRGQQHRHSLPFARKRSGSRNPAAKPLFAPIFCPPRAPNAAMAAERELYALARSGVRSVQKAFLVAIKQQD